MIFSDALDTTAALTSIGIPGLVSIVLVLAGVVVYVFRLYRVTQTEKDTIQEQRLIDAKETRDKLTEPLAQQARMSEQIYDILINQRRK